VQLLGVNSPIEHAFLPYFRNAYGAAHVTIGSSATGCYPLKPLDVTSVLIMGS